MLNRKLVDAVTTHMHKERNRKIKIRERKRKTERYHRSLLSLKLPSEVLSEGMYDEELDSLADLRTCSQLTQSYASIGSFSGMSRSTSVASRLPTIRSLSPNERRVRKARTHKPIMTSSTLSMCGPLDRQVQKKRKNARYHTATQ